MSDLQPSPDLQALFDRLEVAAGGSQVWYSKGRAKPIISEWAKQRDEELRRRIEVLEGMLATLGANYKNLQAVTPQRDEELAALLTTSSVTGRRYCTEDGQDSPCATERAIREAMGETE